MTTKYIFSQIFIVLTYLLLVASYLFKSRRKILLFNIAGTVMQAVSFFLLDAWSGFAVCIVAIVRSSIFFVQSYTKKDDKTTPFDIAVLVLLNVACLVLCFFTYDGPLSLLSIFATMLYTFSVWQKNSKIYKFTGILISACWIAYNSCIFSIFGFVCEVILFVSVVVGLILEFCDFRTKDDKLNPNLVEHLKKITKRSDFEAKNVAEVQNILYEKTGQYIKNVNVLYTIERFATAGEILEKQGCEGFEIQILEQDKKLAKFFSEEQINQIKDFLKVFSEKK